MANQARKTSKRPRKKRSAMAIQGQTKRQVNRETKTVKHGHAPSRRYGGGFVVNVTINPNAKLLSFEDEYRTFKKTRGKRGLNPNPAKRGDENGKVLMRNSVFACSLMPINELMEHPISNLKFYKLKETIGRA